MDKLNRININNGCMENIQNVSFLIFLFVTMVFPSWFFQAHKQFCLEKEVFKESRLCWKVLDLPKSVPYPPALPTKMN